MPEINITCALCGNQKSIELKEHKLQLKRGRQYFFCSKSCAGKLGNKQRWGDKEDDTDLDRVEEWEKGSISMNIFWNQAIAEQRAYEYSKLPFNAGELSLREEMAQAAVRVLNADDQPCGYIEDNPHEQAAIKVMKDRKARIYDAEVEASEVNIYY